LELLKLVHIPDPERRLKSYPHELSGGQRQRVMIAMALANDPDLLIADEPTTALDVTIQAEILRLLAELQKKLGMAILYITHDLRIVEAFASRVYVMQKGRVVEEGTTDDIFHRPGEPYTKMLLAAEPEGSKPPVPAAAPILLDAKKVSVTFRSGGGFFARPAFELKAVCRTSRSRFAPGRRSASWANPAPENPPSRQPQPVHDGGRDHHRGASGARTAACGPRARGSGDQGAGGGRDRSRYAQRFPHEFSGSQRQRIAIARATVLKPTVIVLDEPTSALDRSVQKQIINLLRVSRRAMGSPTFSSATISRW